MYIFHIYIYTLLMDYKYINTYFVKLQEKKWKTFLHVSLKKIFQKRKQGINKQIKSIIGG